MTFDHLSDPSPEEQVRILEAALDFASQHVASPEQMVKLRTDPSAVSVVNRFHGERYDLPQRMMPQAGQGRDTCSICKHPVYFDDRPGFVGPARRVCLTCMLTEVAGQALTAEQETALACPAWCPWLRSNRPAEQGS